MKTLTKLDVLAIAAVLITSNGEVTTLEIKNEARNQGFWAKQLEVSKFVAELIFEDQLAVVNDNNIYRIYSTGSAYTSNPVTAIPASTPVSTVKHFNGTQTITKAITSNLLKAGDWEVSSTTHPDVLNYLGEMTRDEVRSAYAKATGAKFADTRSKRTV